MRLDEEGERELELEGVWRSLIESGLRLHVYSGDDDSICGPIGTQDWIYRLVAKMGLGEEQAWGAWYYIDDVYGDGQVGGYHARWSNASTDGTDGGATGPRQFHDRMVTEVYNFKNREGKLIILYDENELVPEAAQCAARLGERGRGAQRR